MASLNFFETFTKDIQKKGIDVGEDFPPRYWFSSGNYTLNKIMSGSFLRAIPQGRIVCFTGPSGTGKSFLAVNAMREAQHEGASVVVLDSENALDNDFVSAIGVDTTDKSKYIPIKIDTIPQAKQTISQFINNYQEEYGSDPDAPKVLIVLDSLDMLMSESETEQFKKGITKGDQGQRNKQLKAMLRSFVQAIKRLNISMIVTAQVYKNQDLTNGEGNWMVADAIRFSLSLIVLLTKLKLRDDSKTKIEGIRMKCEGYKTRFTKPFQTITLEVPYDTGIDPFNGLLEVAKDMGVVELRGAWYFFGKSKFQSKNFMTYAPEILLQCEETRNKYLEVLIEQDEIDLTPQLSAKKQRQLKTQNENVDNLTESE